MFRNYLVTAFRNVLKRKAYSFINVFGLATGVAVCLIILKYVDFHLSFDSFHKNGSRIYRTVAASYRNGEYLGTGILSGYALGPALLEDNPEIKTYIRTHPMYGGVIVTNDEAVPPLSIHEENIQIVDSTFLDVFTYEFLAGNPSTALDDPSSIVLTESMAKKYFGSTDVLGKGLKLAGGWCDGDYNVTAVLHDVPENTHFSFSFLLPLHNLLKNGQYVEDDGWGWQNFVTYVQLHPHADVTALEGKMAAFIEKHRGERLKQSGTRVDQKFQAIRDIHLNPGLELEMSPTLSMNTIYFFLLIAIFIMAIAWVNYINLSTARAMERAREVGIKKAVGAFRSQLITQFAFESVLVNFIAIVLAVLLAIMLLPVLGKIVEKNFAFDFTDWRLWAALVSLFVLGAVVSGAYPAIVLSSFRTAHVLKGKNSPVGGFPLRKVLVVFQFIASLVLIAGTFAIYRQIIFMKNQDKGLRMDQMLIVSGPRIMEKEGSQQRLATFRDQLKTISSITGVTSSASIPGGGFNWGTTMRKAGDPAELNKSGNVTWVDPDFIQVYEIEMLSGRTWNPESKTDMESVLVNEAAVRTFGLGTPEEALEQRIVLGGDTVDILGVMKDFHWTSLKMAYEPVLLATAPILGANFSIHVSTKNMTRTVADVEAMFKESFPGNPFNFYFLDDFFNKQYKEDQQFARIFGLFALLAIIIACLGLWGLASFTTTQKLKEISIRKVLGASVFSIMTLLSGQFLKLVLVASIIAVPLTWYGIDQWLENFAFSIDIEWDLFVVPAVILGMIALVTVSAQIFRGANLNPATTLRSE